MNELAKNLRSLSKRRNVAREKPYRIMIDNEHERVAKKLLRTHKKRFEKVGGKYSDVKITKSDFVICCEQLIKCISNEEVTCKEFKKIYKPHYEKFQKIIKKYKVKLQQKKRKKS